MITTFNHSPAFMRVRARARTCVCVHFQFYVITAQFLLLLFFLTLDYLVADVEFLTSCTVKITLIAAAVK